MARRVCRRSRRLVVVAAAVIAVVTVLWSLDTNTDTNTGTKHRLAVRYRHTADPPRDGTAESGRTAEAEGVYESLRTILRSAPACVDDALLVILITTAPDHGVQRAAIRRTWCAGSTPAAVGEIDVDASDRRHFQCVFLIGSTPSAATERAVRAETAAHGDIARGRYVDSYRNLTAKVLSGFHWCVRHCRPRFVLKTDDDCFVNVAVLLRLLSLHRTDGGDVYVGKVFSSQAETLVIRSATNRWAVSERDYAPVYYPPYASGIGYLLSAGAVRRLLAESRRVAAFPNEDAYVGVLADRAGLAPVNSYRFTLVSNRWTVCNFRYLVVVHNVTARRQRELWNTARRAVVECRRQKFITTWD